MPDKSPEPPTPGVARGDRREEVWIETDGHQLSKVRHTWPARANAPQEQSEASEEGSPRDASAVTDVAVMPEEPSAWEAREADD